MYLKPRQYYADLYDRHTVYQCRRWLDTKLPDEYYKEQAKKQNVPEQTAKSARAFADNWYVYMHTGERYIKKDETIREWMERDEARDKLFETAAAPENITCLTCGRLMFVSSKHFNLSIGDDKPDTVLFMYDCPLEHLPRRAFYDTGEEFKRTPALCSKCQTQVDEEHKVTKKKFLTILKCPTCRHVEKREIERLANNEDKPDPSFEKDRARFCLSDEDGRKFIDFKHGMEELSKILEKHKEREKEKDVYDAVAQLKKLKITELEEHIRPLLEKEGYIKLQFKNPEITKDVVIPFIVYEQRPDREGRASTLHLEKMLRNVLRGTNWRLMTDGTSYRLGMLEGRFRGYEREEDLANLVRQEEKRVSKLSKS